MRSLFLFSRSHTIRNGLGALALGTALLTVAPAALGEEVEAPAEFVESMEKPAIEEIVVQARKRAELIEDTPISVTALGEARLRENGVTRLDDIQQLVPNLSFGRTPEGQDALVRIRGIGTPRASVQFDPGVGIYVDGVFLARAPGALIDVLDVQQIEVLRGPQGTLFGKNTVGGAINISTVKPHEELEAFAFVRPGNFDLLNARMMLNLPLVEERLLARVAFSSNSRSGYVYNASRDEYLSDYDALNFVGTLRYLPHDDFVVDLTGSWARSRSRGRGGRCVFVQEAGLQNLAPGWADACRKSEPFRVASNVAQLVDNESYGAWLTAAWEPGALGIFEDLSLRSITSWREQIPRLRSDSDGTSLDVIRLSTAGGSPTDGSPGFARQISQELQLNLQAFDDRLSFVGGAFGYWEEAKIDQVLVAFPGVLDRYTRTRTRTDNWNWALYSQASFDATEWLSLTAGMRYTTEKKALTADGRAIDPATGEFLPDAVPDVAGSGAQTFSAWTPMGSIAAIVPDAHLDGTPIDHLMVYFTYAQGFRGGGFNALGATESGGLEAFAPETMNSFEIGTKLIGVDRRLTVNLSLFLGKYDDIQVTSIREIGEPDGDGVPNIIQLTLNAARATTKGVELEIHAIPFDGLDVTGSVGLIDARFDEFLGISDLSGEPIDRSGQTFDETPALQTFLAIQYSLPLELAGPLWLDGWLTPRIDWSYQSSQRFAGPELEAARHRGYNRIGARLAYSFNDGAAEVALWGKNLTNETYFGNSTPIANFFGLTLQYYEEPRTFGAELSYRF
ncbi:MAG: TonB-dependent receptor [Deltaproteobacteria bacterium]